MSKLKFNILSYLIIEISHSITNVANKTPIIKKIKGDKSENKLPIYCVVVANQVSGKVKKVPNIFYHHTGGI
jgi:hypothetical protein